MTHEQQQQTPHHDQHPQGDMGKQHGDEKPAIDPIADKYGSGEGKMTENPAQQR